MLTAFFALLAVCIVQWFTLVARDRRIEELEAKQAQGGFYDFREI